MVYYTMHGHNVKLLRMGIDTLWYIDQEKVTVFSGTYDDYKQETTNKRASLDQQLSRLGRQTLCEEDYPSLRSPSA